MGDEIPLCVVNTIPGRCRQCYSCVRHCPAKAIMVRDGQATVMGERCIACGHCVQVCSQQAKKVASDLTKVRQIVAEGRDLCACVAPSFVAEFHPARPRQVAAALRQLGFRWVYEVAYGAELVTGEYRRLLREAVPGGLPVLSTPCPAITTLVEKHFPSLVPLLAPVVSPMVAAARAAKARLGDVQAVFIGPCVAKIEEARDSAVTGAVDGVLSFPELRAWWEESGIDVCRCPEESFDSPAVSLGRLYPVPGGLLRTAALRADVLDNDILTVEGRDRCLAFLRALEKGEVKAGFVDILFCEGCIDGPLARSNLPVYGRRTRVVEEVRRLPPPSLRLAEPPPGVDLRRQFRPRSVVLPEPTPEQIAGILRELDKTRPEDELNCGACGYHSCRDKAVAVFQGLAENKMCLPYLVDQLQKNNAELAYLKDYNKNIVESIAEGIVVVDRAFTITTFNDARRHVSDRPREDILGRSLFAVLPHLNVPEVRTALQRVMEAGGPATVQELRYRLAGRSLVVNVRAYPLKGERGEVLGAVLVCQDITEEKRMFARLAESERLASLGRLAAGVAHEINNPLTLVSGYAELLRDSAVDQVQRQQATVIVEEVDRIASIVRNLLTFARQQPGRMVECDVKALLGRLCALLGAQAHKADVELHVEVDPDLPPVGGNPAELEQVFLNLMINALEAMPSGGELRVRARLSHAGDRGGSGGTRGGTASGITTNSDTSGGPWLEIEFTDTGCGIKEEHLDRIFEPFFTTKEVGKGTGLGLSVSYGIVRKHGGTIDVSSQPGQGSTFVVRLPLKANGGER